MHIRDDTHRQRNAGNARLTSSSHKPRLTISYKREARERVYSNDCLRDSDCLCLNIFSWRRAFGVGYGTAITYIRLGTIRAHFALMSCSDEAHCRSNRLLFSSDNICLTHRRNLISSASHKPLLSAHFITHVITYASTRACLFASPAAVEANFDHMYAK